MSSILNSTKKILGLDYSYTAFDMDIITHINAAFSVLNQLGIGPADGFFIESTDESWDEFIVPTNQMNLVKTYVYLKVRMFFDPPSTSYLIEAMNKQIAECEWRLSLFRELVEHPLDELLAERVLAEAMIEEGIT